MADRECHYSPNGFLVLPISFQFHYISLEKIKIYVNFYPVCSSTWLCAVATKKSVVCELPFFPSLLFDRYDEHCLSRQSERSKHMTCV